MTVLCWDPDGDSGNNDWDTGAGLGGATAAAWNQTDAWVDFSGGRHTWNNANLDTAVLWGTAGTVSLGSAITAGSVLFKTTGYQINDATNVLNLPSVGQLTVDFGVSGTLAAAIAGTNPQKTGSGTLRLTRSNTFSGGLSVHEGTVEATVAAALPGTTWINGGTVLWNSPTATWNNTVTGAGTLQVQLGSGATTTKVAGDLSGFHGTLDVLPYNGVSGGKLQFANAAGYPSASATVQVESGATIWLSQGGTLGSSILLYGGTTGEPHGQLRLENGSGVAGQVTLMANSTIGAHITVGTIAGPIVENSPGLSLTKQGSGTVVLRGPTAYTGNTTISTGTLQLGDGDSLTGAVAGNIVNNSSLVVANPQAQTIGNLISGTGRVQKIGNGPLTLTAANTYTGSTTVSAGTLQLGDGSSLNGAVGGSIVNNGQLVFANPLTQTFGGAISGSGAVEKTSGGTLTLSGSNSYGGGLTVSAGTVEATGAAALPGTTTIAGGSTVRLKTPTATWNNTIVGAGTLQVQLGAGATTTNVTGNLSGFTGVLEVRPYDGVSGGKLQFANAAGYPNASATVEVQSGATMWLSQGGSFLSPIRLYGGPTGEAYGQLRVDNNSVVSGPVTLMADSSIGAHATPGTIAGPIVENAPGLGLTVQGSGTVVFTGAKSYTGDTTISSGTLQLGDGDALTGSVAGNIVDNANLMVANPEDQTISQVISGTGSVQKTGDGVLLLMANNTYKGVTTIHAGTLQLGAGGTSGAIASRVVNNGVLIFDRSDNVTFAYAISGTGRVTKRNTNTLTLQSDSTYTGPTAVLAGTLHVVGWLRNSNVETAPGAQFKGTGAVAERSVSGLVPGATYELWTTWMPNSSRSANIPYQIYDGAAFRQTILVDQRTSPTGLTIDGTEYFSLGRFPTETGTLTVKTLSQTDGTAEAGVLQTTAAEPEKVLYRLLSLDFHVGETASPITINNVTVQNPGWLDSGSWQAAVLQAAGGTFAVSPQGTGTPVPYTFPDGCKIGYVAEFSHYPGNELISRFHLDPTQKIVVFEDWTDGDYDDDYWLVTTESGPTVAIASGTAVEGDLDPTTGLPEKTYASFAVTLSGPSDQAVTVTYSISLVDDSVQPLPPGTAKANLGNDVVAVCGSITIPPGMTTGSISAEVLGDIRDEYDELFAVELTSADHAVVVAGTKAQGTILDNDAPPELTVNDPIVSEPDLADDLSPEIVDLVFALSLSVPSEKDISLHYATQKNAVADPTLPTDTGPAAATPGADFSPVGGDITITPNPSATPGYVAATVKVPIRGDLTDEYDELLNLILSGVDNATLADAQGVGTIVDNDDPPEVSISDASVEEGNLLGGEPVPTKLAFTITVMPPSEKVIAVDWQTHDWEPELYIPPPAPAEAGKDYQSSGSSSSTANFAPRQTTAVIEVVVSGDEIDEYDEVFHVALTTPQNATLATGHGEAVGTIVDDDAPPELTVNDVIVREGDTAQFNLTLSRRTEKSLKVTYATHSQSAQAIDDFDFMADTWTVADDELSKTVSVPTKNDYFDEGSETFELVVAAQEEKATVSSEDSARTATIVGVDLDADSNNDGVIDPADDPRADRCFEETKPGKILYVGGGAAPLALDLGDTARLAGFEFVLGTSGGVELWWCPDGTPQPIAAGTKFGLSAPWVSATLQTTLGVKALSAGDAAVTASLVGPDGTVYAADMVRIEIREGTITAATLREFHYYEEFAPVVSTSVSLQTTTVSSGDANGNPAVRQTISPGNRYGLAVKRIGAFPVSDIRYVVSAAGADIAGQTVAAGAFQTWHDSQVEAATYLRDSGDAVTWASLMDVPGAGDYTIHIGIDRNVNRHLELGEVTHRIGMRIASIGDAVVGGNVVAFAGEFPYDANSVLLSGDPEFASNVAYHANEVGAAYNTSIGSWADVVATLNGYEDATLSSIWLIGHCHANVAAVLVSPATSTYLGSPIPADAAEVIARKLAADAPLVMGGCEIAHDTTAAGMVQMADQIGHSVIGNMGTGWGGTSEGQGLWVAYPPGE